MREHVTRHDGRACGAWLRSVVREVARWCLAICVVATSCGAALAETSDGCLTGDWIAEARRFVAEETGTAVPDVCVRFASIDRLASLARSAAPGRAHDDALAAVYVPGTREILLAQDFDPGAILTRSYLVHELVHAQQFAARKHLRVSCSGSLEGDAYNAQALYLSTRDHPEDAFLLQVLGMMQSACDYTY